MSGSTAAAAPARRTSPLRSIPELIWARPMPRKSAMTEPDRPTFPTFVGGGQAGCNWQSGTVVAGLEGDFDYFHSNSNFYNNTDTLPTLARSLRRRAIAHHRLFGDRASAHRHRRRPQFRLRHRRRRIHQSELHRELRDGSAPPGTGIASASKFLTGWTAGAGWEYALTDHWLIRFEYLFAAFPTTSATGVITGPGAEPIRCTAPPTSSCRSPAPA